MIEDIDKKLKEISKKHTDAFKKESSKEESKYYADLYSVEIENVEKINEEISFYGRKRKEWCSSIIVNKYKFSYKCDQYKNLTGKFNCFPSSYALKVFADKLRRSEEKQNSYNRQNHPYTYRIVQQLFVSLCDQYHKQITPEKLFEILNISLQFPVEKNDRLRNGFASWLLTRSYCCDDAGQFSFGGFFGSGKKWTGERDFFLLLAKDSKFEEFFNQYRREYVRSLF